MSDKVEINPESIRIIARYHKGTDDLTKIGLTEEEVKEVESGLVSGKTIVRLSELLNSPITWILLRDPERVKELVSTARYELSLRIRIWVDRDTDKIIKVECFPEVDEE